MRSGRPIRARGAALLIMVMILGLGATWYLVSQLNVESGGMTAVNRARNAQTLNRAKLALIGYVAAKAAEAGENNPGRFPCPEAVNTIGTTSEGTSAPTVTPSSPTCNSIGRLPWRTIGLEKLVDTAGEPLWYVVGPSWRLATSSSTLLINSNTAGDLAVDGQQVVALIIAPGAAINAQSATGCTAQNQTRSAPAPSMDAANYIECFNSGTLQFFTTASSSSYNDQAVRITVADVMPAIEAAIANRIEREIVPALNAMYAPSTWGISGTNPIYPFATPFGPTFPNPSASDYKGVAGTYQGLLPFNQTQGCDPTTEARCSTTFTAWASPSPASPPDVIKVSGYGSFQTKTCSWESGGDVAYCRGEYLEDSSNEYGAGMVISMTATINNVAMGLRVLDATKATIEAEDDYLTGTLTTITPTVTATMNNNGSATITVTGTLPIIEVKGWGSYANYRIRLDRSVIGDHTLLSSTNATTGWFARNEWYRLTYYAVTQSYTATAIPSVPASCSVASPACLSVANVTGSQRAILILTGRSVNGGSRPSSTLADYLEFGNANAAYEKQSTGPVLAKIYSDTGTADNYNVGEVGSLATGAGFQFKAQFANSGPTSTLNTSVTGTRALVNLDGTNLAAGTIQANAAVQVIWDGTQFLLSKRPFNDRIVAVSSN